MLQVVFWIAIAVVGYTFLGYGIVISLLVKLKGLIRKNDDKSVEDFIPNVTLVVPCYNEADIIKEKIVNSLSLEYPNEKIEIVFITDGSNDHFREVLGEFPSVKLLHEDRRAGKTAAENRAMKFVDSPFVVFTDANTMLNKKAIKNIVKHFSNDNVGCVSGEKRVLVEEEDSASSAGEGMYWKYESFLKKMDSKFYSAVGAAGELVAFRTSLYRDLPEDTILDDFMQSLLIASDGYRIVYEPDAYAMETGSDSTSEELKRKVRISAGGWQSMKRLFFKITPFNHPLLFFQYLSHRVLRWTITPFLLILIFLLNFFLLNEGFIYQLLMIGQVFFYAAAFVGYVLENRKLRIKVLFIPFYFCMMNYAVVAGLFRFLKGSQKSTWEKSKRKS
ncbi:glycosyltransferase family 2 protein [Cyclobacterium marinum]|uniref:Glycosyl transferase family 2 n=1 Tax=Cyclobacterium marinum (strain ATCC 25205 / DSM 745 / LMG 13164 / NCIMB 1802) TaxID=880070 RepID=G0J8D1_CYCMS|nr:glycosyltransferase family 2 protein [Cyclobacterium marinum]AEL28731.1 glycosyl transferase family 2 [Cyclobacterium marinum DSM 745]|tara:strand:+ start:135851 stop:137017 length:1167 start_codon:yes stop_codon:yes gene_type:complete